MNRPHRQPDRHAGQDGPCRGLLEAEYYALLSGWANAPSGDIAERRRIVAELGIEPRRAEADLRVLRELDELEAAIAGREKAEADLRATINARRRAKADLRDACAAVRAADNAVAVARGTLDRCNEARARAAMLRSGHARLIKRAREPTLARSA